MQLILRLIRSIISLGLLSWIITAGLPAQAVIRQLEDAPGQIVYQSRQTLSDQHDNSWQVIAFNQTLSDSEDHIFLRLVGPPDTAKIDHSQPLSLIHAANKTLIAADVSDGLCTDQYKVRCNTAQYDLQPIMAQLDSATSLQLIVPTLDRSEITLAIPPSDVAEWQWIVSVNTLMATTQTAIRQVEEAPGQIVYQSRQILKDQLGNSWQAIAFKRTLVGSSDRIFLRLVGFPGIANIDHSQPLSFTNSLGKTLIAVDVSRDMFTDQNHVKPDAGQYDIQPILMQLAPAIPLRLVLMSVDQSEITMNIPPASIEEWQLLVKAV